MTSMPPSKRFLMDERIKIHVEPRYVKEEDWNGQRIRPFQKEALKVIKKSDARIIFNDFLGFSKFY